MCGWCWLRLIDHLFRLLHHSSCMLPINPQSTDWYDLLLSAEFCPASYGTEIFKLERYQRFTNCEINCSVNSLSNEIAL